MYGYIRFYGDELKMKDLRLFKAYYCGLCHTLKHNYGQRGRMLLSYDMTFMAIFIDAVSGEKLSLDRLTCPVSPWKKKLTILNSRGLEKAAFLSILMGYYKMEDVWQDDRMPLAKVAMALYKKAFRRTSDQWPETAAIIEEKLREFYQNEKTSGIGLDELTHPFAELIALVLSSDAEEGQKDVFYKIGYHAGRWLYFIDALDDLPKDVTKGSFNAFTATLPYSAPTWQQFYEAAKDDIYANLFVSLDEIHRYLKFLNIKQHRELIENIFYLGIRSVSELILCRRRKGNDEPFAEPFKIRTTCRHGTEQDALIPSSDFPEGKEASSGE